MSATALPLPVQFIAVWLASLLARQQQQCLDYLKAENRLLRQKLGPGRLRFTDSERRRLAIAGKRVGRKALAELSVLASPDTILRWYRELVARKYDGSAKRRPGRPRKPGAITRILLRMARENPTWGYVRLRGALHNLGHDVSKSTIKRRLREHGIDPAPIRRKGMSWATFIKAHAGAIAAADFFTVEVLSWAGLVRLHVFFLIDIASRRVEIAGITRFPHGDWMKQIARNLLDCDDGFLRNHRYIILDRDPLYTKAFRSALRNGSVEPLGLPAKSPDLNAYAERFVLSIKSECLQHIVPLGEAHLRRVINEYIAHYHTERNHQGIDNKLIFEGPEPSATGRVDRKTRLGGLLSFYYRRRASSEASI